MPIYAYRCDACGHAQDVLQKISDPVLTVCPACGAAAYRKQPTAAGFQLKGSGWYATDFRGPGSKPEGATKGEEATAGDSATEKKEEAPAAAGKPAGTATPAAPEAAAPKPGAAAAAGSPPSA